MLVTLTDRGTITIPKKLRKQNATKYFECTQQGDDIILHPVQTRDEFLAELDEAEREWQQKGGITLEEYKQKHSVS